MRAWPHRARGWRLMKGPLTGRADHSWDQRWITSNPCASMSHAWNGLPCASLLCLLEVLDVLRVALNGGLGGS